MSKVDAVMKAFAFHMDTLGSFVGSLTPGIFSNNKITIAVVVVTRQ